MKTERCEQYLLDPETHAAHIAECDSCRAMFEELDTRVPGSVRIDALPMAPWEGASHRSWPLVIGGTLALAAIAAALFAMAGLSPIATLIDSIRASIPSSDLLSSIMRLAPGAIQHAPAGWQIVIAVSFIVVNAMLLLLLRRAPKGIDV